MLPIQTIEVDISQVEPCDGLQEDAENNVDSNGDCLVIDAPPCNCIKHFGGEIPVGYYQVVIGEILYHCPLNEVEGFGVDADIIDANNLSTGGKYNLNDPLGLSLFLKKVYVKSIYEEESVVGTPFPYVSASVQNNNGAEYILSLIHI